jgi:hypothetical protein
VPALAAPAVAGEQVARPVKPCNAPATKFSVGRMKCNPGPTGSSVATPRFEGGAVLPHRVERIKRVILGIGAFEQMELDEARHLVEMAVARQLDMLEGGLGPLGDAKPVHCDKHRAISQPVVAVGARCDRRPARAGMRGLKSHRSGRGARTSATNSCSPPAGGVVTMPRNVGRPD